MPTRQQQRLLLGTRRAYTKKVQALSPIAYWPLAESSGSVATDESGNARDGAYTSVALGAAGIGDGRSAATFTPTTSLLNVYSASFAAAFSGAEGSAAMWLQMSAAGIWTDATFHEALKFRVDANNSVTVEKTSTNNQIRTTYIAGATGKSINDASLAGSVAWFHVAMTWSKSNDRMRMYINGVQSGANQTGLGTFAGSPASTTTCIGANDTTPTFVWSGNIAHVAIWSRELSAAEVAAVATV